MQNSLYENAFRNRIKGNQLGEHIFTGKVSHVDFRSYTEAKDYSEIAFSAITHSVMRH